MFSEGRRVAKRVESTCFDHPDLNGKLLVPSGEGFPSVYTDFRLVGYLYSHEDAVAWLRENNFVFAIDNVD